MDLTALKRANEIEKELTRIKLVLNDLKETTNYEFDVNYSSGSRKRSLTDLLSPQFKKLITDEVVIMPNHIHGIIIKEHVGAGPCACPKQINDKDGATTGSRPYNFSLSNVIERFKSLTTFRYIEEIDNSNWQPFNGKLWQRNYYDHIIRNNPELNTYRKYIQDNPSKWKEDEYFIE